MGNEHEAGSRRSRCPGALIHGLRIRVRGRAAARRRSSRRGRRLGDHRRKEGLKTTAWVSPTRARDPGARRGRGYGSTVRTFVVRYPPDLEVLIPR